MLTYLFYLYFYNIYLQFSSMFFYFLSQTRAEGGVGNHTCTVSMGKVWVCMTNDIK